MVLLAFLCLYALPIGGQVCIAQTPLEGRAVLDGTEVSEYFAVTDKIFTRLSSI